MTFSFRKQFAVVFLLATLFGCRENSTLSSGGVEAKDALATFQVADGFKIEMIASEPLIADPVDMEIDEYGRMYVVEMHGYPLDKSGSGNIIVLTDENGDGTMDKRHVFTDKLTLPTSILRWKKGVMVTDAPNLLYLEDTDGDFKADVVDTLLHGFALSNPQHNVNSPVYGLDNWIYIAHEGSVSTREYKEEFGDEGSEIIFPGDPSAPKLPKNANGRSVRFKPDEKLIEMLSGRCQFGHTFDKWGHLFGSNNSNQGYHQVIASRYFQRNPLLTSADAVHNMSDHLNAAEVFPTTTHPDRQILTNVGVMTSACGLTSYLGGAFPAPYNGNITFIAEPVSNLVHVDVLRDSGASFTASRILQNKEFLSSTDAWSRPVNMYVGPDGALYVLDYYRRVIESPEWMSEEAIKAGNLYDGSDKGRIFRITPKEAKAADWTKGLKLGDASDDELVKYLADRNNWWRLNAQRLLVDRKGKSSVPALIEMTQSASTMGRLHALWTLEGLGELKAEQIEKALRDSVSGIRQTAIQLAEMHLTETPALAKSLLKLRKDPNEKVRFQLLLALGFDQSAEAAAARNELLFSDINDKWVQIAALSASASQTPSLLKEVLRRFDPENGSYSSLVERLTSMIAMGGNANEIHRLIEQSCSPVADKQAIKNAAILQGLATGLNAKKGSVKIPQTDEELLVNTFFTRASMEMRKASLLVLKASGITNPEFKAEALDKAAALMCNTAEDYRKRADAIEFLMLDDPSPYEDQIKKLIVPAEQPVVQLAALKTFSKIKGTEVSKYVIKQWPVLTPEIRDEAIGTFLVDSLRIVLLIDALEQDIIKPSSVSFPRSVQLMQNKNDVLRSRARTLFTKIEREREKINKEYKKSLELTGDPLKGKQAYVQNCALCHQVRGKFGIAIGPDLGTIHNWLKEDILANVLDPNLSISSGFDMWNVELSNGETVQGMIASETPTAITLRNNGKLDRTVNRSDIKVLQAMNSSAMPTGFEKSIDHQQMADLLAFLRQH